MVIIDAPLRATAEMVEPESFVRSVIYDALHFDPTRDAFPPLTRNPALVEARRKMIQQFPDGETRLVQGINQELEATREQMGLGKVVIETLAYGERMWPSAPVELKLTKEIRRRGLWWNERARRVLTEGGIDGLISDPALICLALGTGQWLDTANFMVEPRFVGDSLELGKKAGIDLYQRFGLKPEDFVFFPHMKHKPGFYNETYRHLLFGDRVTEETFLKSYGLIYELMKINNQNVLLVPGTWFYDTNLPEIDSKFSWVGKTAEKIVVLGKAKELDPIQLQFAISQSGKRRAVYEAGDYQPQIAAAFTSREFLGNVLKLENEKKDRAKKSPGN